MWTWKSMSLYLAATAYLLVGATAYYTTRYQTLLRQHQDHPKMKIKDEEYCAILMIYRNLYRMCKPFHVFIHASEEELRDVCGLDGYPFYGTGKRQSKIFYPLTVCRLGKMMKAQKCIYYTTSIFRRLVLRCDEDGLPEYLDEVFTMSG